ncbi:MAG: DUF2971 domain-containing protein [Bacteroidales bacterium]
MNDVDRIFKNLYSEDIVYHYTKASTAIDHILFYNQLKFNNVRKLIDPIESKPAHRICAGSLGVNCEKISESDLNDLLDFVINIENSICQISFCKNEMGQDFESPFYRGDIEGNEEYFGFTKPRMWEQYANNYSGVCIAFSKKKLLALNNKSHELIDGDVEYITNSQLKYSKMGDINLDFLLEKGLEEYKKEAEKKIMSGLFYKHKDYIGENEYRIVSQFKKSRCNPIFVQGELEFDTTMTLDISRCIEAIFVSSYANYKQKRDLLEYANKLVIPMIEMNWQYNNLKIVDYKMLRQISFNLYGV